MPYLFNTDDDRRAMLSAIGAKSIDQLFEMIPAQLRLGRPLDVPAGMTEIELTTHLSQLAAKNSGLNDSVCFLGGGAYDHFIPAAVDSLASRGEFYTSYTPYQPEVSQGNLQVMFEYETMICQLTGMDVSNASLYDGATAAIEGALMCLAASEGRRKVVVPTSLHPEYRQCLQTYLRCIGAQLVEVPVSSGVTALETWQRAIDAQTACVLIQQPNFFGCLEDARSLATWAKSVGALVVAVVDPISLGIITSPGDWGADIVVAEGQTLGNPLQFGGPYLGILACREAFVRRVPGRIAGQTEDRLGRRCWVLTLQTREQHIRREKATSNVCTNQGLFALRAAIYLSLQGPQGLRETAELCAQKAHYFQDELRKSDRFELPYRAPNWREFVVRDRENQVDALLNELRVEGIMAGLPLGRWYSNMQDCFLIAVTEKRTRQEIDRCVRLLQDAPTQVVMTHA